MGFDEGLTHCSLLFEADDETTQRHEGTFTLAPRFQVPLALKHSGFVARFALSIER